MAARKGKAPCKPSRPKTVRVKPHKRRKPC